MADSQTVPLLTTETQMNAGHDQPAKGSRSRLFLFVLCGLISGAIAAFLISKGYWAIAFAAAAAVPLVVLISEHPFLGIMIWLLVMPFVTVLPRSDLVYWGVYRIMPLLLLCMAIMSRIFKVREHPPVRFGPPELSMGILILLVPGTILFSQANPGLALIRFGDRMVLPFCMYLVVRLTAPREKEFSQLKWVVLFIAISQSVIGFLSWIAPQVLPQLWHYLQGQRTTGSLKDPDLYAAVHIFCAIILIHAAVNDKSKVIRFLLLVAAGSSAVFTILSMERAAWLGGIFVGIGLLFLYPKIMFRFLIISTIVVAVVGVEIVATNSTTSLLTRFSESDPINDRLVIFDAMTQMVEIKPVLGWGYETLDQNIAHYYRRVGEASLSRIVTSHNTYMTILTELGMVGFIFYLFPVLWWFLLTLRVWGRMLKKGLWSRSLLAGFWLALLFQFTISNFFDMRWFEIGLTLWWLTLGLISNMVYPYLKGRDINRPAQIDAEYIHG
jgi:O-antigen ligase